MKKTIAIILALILTLSLAGAIALVPKRKQSKDLIG